MPKIVERLVKQLIANGMAKDKAYAVAISQMQKAGNIDKKGKATSKGLQRGNMTPAERAKSRAVKTYGGESKDYKYNKHNNSTVKGAVNSKVKKRK